MGLLPSNDDSRPFSFCGGCVIANSYVVNASLKFNVSTASLRPIVSTIQQQLSNQKVSIPVSVRINKNVSADLAKQNTAFKTFNKTLQQTATISLKAATNLNVLRKSLHGVASQFGTIAPGISKIGSATQQLSSSAKTVDSLGTSFKNVNGKVVDFYQSIGIAIRRFSTFAIAAGAIAGLAIQVRDAVKAAIEFDQELVRLKQIGQDTPGAIKGIADEVTRLSTTLGVSSSELIKVSVVLRQADLSATQTQKALDALAKTTLSPTFDNLANTTEGAIAIMAQFKTKAGELKGQLGSLSRVSADYAVESSDLVEAVRRTGGAFKAAGGNLNELFAAFTSIRATTRESAESISTGLRTILARLQDPEISKKLRGYGIELYNLKGQFIGVFPAIQQLHDKLTQLDSKDIRFTSILKDLGGLRQLSRVLPLITEFPKAQKAYNSALAGTKDLDRDAITAQEAFAQSLSKLKEQFLDLFRTISNDSSVRAFLNTLIGGISLLNTALKELKPLIPLFGALAVVSFGKSLKGGALGRVGEGFKGVRGYALSEGGKVPNRRGSISIGTDSVPALLTPDEFVLPAKRSKEIGHGTLTSLLHGTAEVVKKGTRGAFRGAIVGAPQGLSSALLGAVSGGIAGIAHRKRYAEGGVVKPLYFGEEYKNYLENPSQLRKNERYQKLGLMYGEEHGPQLFFNQLKRNYKKTLPDFSTPDALNLHKYTTRGIIEDAKLISSGKDVDNLSPMGRQNALDKLKSGSRDTEDFFTVMHKETPRNAAPVGGTMATNAHGTATLQTLPTKKGLFRKLRGLFSRHATGGLTKKLQGLLSKLGVDVDARQFIQSSITNKSASGVGYNGLYYSGSGTSTQRGGRTETDATKLHEFGHGVDYNFNKHKYGANTGGFLPSETPGHPFNKVAQLFKKYSGPTGQSGHFTGGAGLAKYKPEEQDREAFAQAFTSHALGKGIQSGKLRTQDYPNVSDALKDPAFQEASGIFDKHIIPSLQKFPKKDVFPARPSKTDVAAGIQNPYRKQAADQIRGSREKYNTANMAPVPTPTAPPFVPPTPITPTPPPKPPKPTRYGYRLGAGRGVPPQPPGAPPKTPSPRGPKTYGVGPQLVPYKIAATSSGGPQPAIPKSQHIQTLLQNGQSPIHLQGFHNNQKPTQQQANSHFGLTDQYQNFPVRGDLPTQKYSAQLKDTKGNLFSKSVRATSQAAAKDILEAGGASVQSIKTVDDAKTKFKKSFGKLRDFFKDTSSQVQSVSGGSEGVGASPKVSAGGTLNRKGRALKYGGLGAAALGSAYVASKYGGEPGSAGVAAGALEGGLTGGFLGGQVLGVPGAVIGATIGAGAGAYGQSTTQRENKTKADNDKNQAQLEKSLEDVNPVTGKFKSSASQTSFNDATNKLRHKGQSEIDKEQYGILSEDDIGGRGKTDIGRKGERELGFGDLAGGIRDTYFSSNADIAERSRKESVKEEEDRRTQNAPIAEANVGKIKEIAEKNPGVSFEDLQKKAKPFFDSLGQLGPVGQEAIKSLKEETNLRKKVVDALNRSNDAFALTVAELEKFNDQLTHASEGFETRNQYSSQGSSAIQGQLTAAPSNVSLGNLGGPETVAGKIHEFGKTGGGYDQAKQALLGIIQDVSHNPKLAPDSHALEIEKRFGQTDVAKTQYGGLIKEHIGAAVGDAGFNEKLGSGQIAGITDQILEKVKPVKDASQSGNKQLQQAYGQSQQNQLDTTNRKFALDQQKAETVSQFVQNTVHPRQSQEAVEGVISTETTRTGTRFANEGRARTFNDNRREHGLAFRGNPVELGLKGTLKALGRDNVNARDFTKGGAIVPSSGKLKGINYGLYNTRGVSPEERQIERDRQKGQLAFEAHQETIIGVEGSGRSSSKELVSAIGTNQTKLAGLQEERQKAVSGGAPLEKVRQLDADIAKTGDSIRRLGEGLKGLAGNTTALEAAQKQYNLTVTQAKGDLDSRKSDADVLTYGSQQEKQQLYQKEALVQQSASLSPEQFQQLPDQVKKIIGDRLKETPDRARSIDQYDKRGRYRGQRDYTGAELQQEQTRPFVTALNNEPAARRLQARAKGAEADVNTEVANLAKNQKAAQGVQAEDIAKQSVQLAASFQTFVTDINKGITDQIAATQVFLNNSKDLTLALNSFPKEISIKRDGVVQVILNGADVINSMKGDLEKNIFEQVIAQLQVEVAKQLKNQPAR